MKKLGHAVVVATLLSAVLSFSVGFTPNLWIGLVGMAAVGFGFWFGLWHAYLQTRAKRVLSGLIFAGLAVANLPLWVFALRLGVDARVSDFRERLGPYENAVQEISKRRLTHRVNHLYYFSQEFSDIPGGVVADVGADDELTVTFHTGMRCGLLYSSSGSPPPVEFWTFRQIKPNWFVFDA